MYGIKVPLDEGYVWVTASTRYLEPLLFDEEQKALVAAEIWGEMAIVEKYEGT